MMLVGAANPFGKMSRPVEPNLARNCSNLKTGLTGLANARRFLAHRHDRYWHQQAQSLARRINERYGPASVPDPQARRDGEPWRRLLWERQAGFTDLI